MTSSRFSTDYDKEDSIQFSTDEPESSSEIKTENPEASVNEEPNIPVPDNSVVSGDIRKEIAQAINGNDSKIVENLKSLLSKNYKLPAKTEKEYNLLYLACYKVKNDKEAKNICELLLELGEDLETSGIWGITPVFQAANSGLLETLKFLVDKGANLNKKALTNVEKYSTPFEVTILDYAKLGKHDNPLIVSYLKSKGQTSSTYDTQVSNASTNDKHVKMVTQASFNFKKLPKNRTLDNYDETLAILGNLVETIKALPTDLQEFLISSIKITSPSEVNSLKIVSASDFSRVLAEIKKEHMKEAIGQSKIISDPSIYTLTEDYEDTPYYHLVSMTTVNILKKSMPKKPGKTVEEYVVENLSNPASPFLPSNTDRLESFLDYLAAVIFKIFMRVQQMDNSFDDLHKEITEEYGPTNSHGGQRKITSTIYSSAYSAADFLEENLLAKDVSLKRKIEEIYESIKNKIDSAFDLENEGGNEE